MTSTITQSDAEVSSASFSHGGGRSSSTTTSKLRDSCQACALSKVKCHKQKPTCSRCIKRKIPCEYIMTKRPGRKRDNSTHVSTKNDSNGETMETAREGSSATQNQWLGMTSPITADSALSGNSNIFDSLNLGLMSPRSDNVSGVEPINSDMMSSFWMSLENCSSEHMGTSNEFDELLNSPVDFCELQALDHQLHAQGCNDIAKLLIPDDTNALPLSEATAAEPLNTSGSPSTPRRLSIFRSDTNVNGAPEPCLCLILALEILSKISSDKISASPQSNNREYTMKMSHVGPSIANGVPSTQNVVLENKQVIQALTAMLQCSCGEDGYILMLLSMIVFRIVGRYAAAAFKHPNEDGDGLESFTKEHKRRLNSFEPEDEGSRRKAAQLILNELHRVQRLINDLSLKLQAHGHGPGGNSNERISIIKNSRWESQNPTLSDHLTKAEPFSAVRFAQLERDMRRCLSLLSSEIINMLQQI
ncbi:hypothetical protein UA08_09364 [Talaromyces atroroseus]|uniref:Zn(2)-C6 fungal-type domain-containing protein n=1 Tax=Talaromyces atroroseus TaxID=1441469 RepID=A0A1Q5Q6B1_TALAT|nr:hypothetical protein UA08_09364 [Talaromyces atroroseus]OKL55387.1 hypothetical protein UA08_09364 [Talaromyces atroroseus]